MKAAPETVGKVYLLGAGPGDPELISVKGLRLLRTADCIVHDRLVSHELLQECRPEAELINVGKRGGHYGVEQASIHRILVEKARKGLTVVRLKGGDPFVFGRGGEEAEFLIANEIPFEVIPGVSSVTAAPMAAGIPLTHRGLASSVTILTGHEADQEASRINWKAVSNVDTLVILMPLGNLQRIVSRLILSGRPISTPAALVQSATLPHQRVLRSTLGHIAREAVEQRFESPAILVVGEVAKLDYSQGTAQVAQVSSPVALQSGEDHAWHRRPGL